jgi:hypothetical protein
MRSTRMPLVATLAVAALLSLATSAAGADFWIEPGGSASATSQGSVTFGSSPTIQCDVTLDGTLTESVMDTEAEGHIGAFTEVQIANCSGGNVSAVLSLPWEITLNSFEGEYPNELTNLLVDIADMSLNLSVFGGLVNCLYGGTAGAALVLAETEEAGFYEIESVVSLEETLLPLVRGSGTCPDEGGLSAEFAFTPEQLVVTQPLGEIEVSPTSVTIDPEETDESITVRNKGVNGSTDIDIAQESLRITADDAGILIAPGETCEGSVLVAFANDCRIVVYANSERDGALPHSGRLTFTYSNGPVSGIDVEIPLLATDPDEG